jgi:hypothetical protein
MSVAPMKKKKKIFPAPIDEYLTITTFNGAKYFY